MLLGVADMKFDDIKIGEIATSEHKVTASDINDFVRLSGDDNKIHVDPGYAGETKFKDVVAHGMLGMSFISKVIGTQLPGDGALWYSQDVEFLLPARIGDVLLVRVEVLNKHRRDRMVEIKTEIYNQHKQKITTGVGKVKLIEREQGNQTLSDKKSPKIAIVFGASGGIGSATCRALVRDGYKVVVHYNQRSAQAVSLKDTLINAGGDAITSQADINSVVQVTKVHEMVCRQYGSPSLVVNCATSPIKNLKFFDHQWEDYVKQFEIHVGGMFNLLHVFAPEMLRRGEGCFVALTTLYTDLPEVQLPHYISAKSSLEGFVRVAAKELGPNGVRLNMVSPGMVDTALITDVPEKTLLIEKANTPLKSISTPEQVAEAICFLGSEKAAQITGETIRVNGGRVMR
jgi:3-oxoacyl-[acyl-carrier protein] reductase